MSRRALITSAIFHFILSATIMGQESGIDANNFDKKTRIQDDFYRAVNGTWLGETAIPADKSNYGSFTVLADLSEQRLRRIIEAAAARHHEKGTDAQKVGNLFNSFMDQERIDQLGVKPISSKLADIETVNDRLHLSSTLW